MLSIVKAEYQGREVSITEDGWLNATQEAEKHGKRVADWLENQETKVYLSALAAHLNVPKERDLIRARRGRNGGTWLHPKLTVAFARWLSPDFAVWCDLLLDSLFQGKHPHFDWKRLRHEATSSFKVMNDALKLVREEQGKVAASHHYTNEARLINWALTGEFKGLSRDALPLEELDLLAKLEVKNSVLIGRGLVYAARKTILEQYAIDLRQSDERKILRA